jgi:hypothetical protein
LSDTFFARDFLFCNTKNHVLAQGFVNRGKNIGTSADELTVAESGTEDPATVGRFLLLSR